MGLRLAAAFSLTLGLGCAAMMNGSTQPVTFRSSPSGASVTVNGSFVGSTPSPVKLKRDPSRVPWKKENGVTFRAD